ncbi:kinase-like protein [Leucogyrophana mollusca]|uniref:Kinase-like protein n=1 Tax=Leucogyrophana mollusca TaxID=85980 RepID=A0ACB8B2Q6_9AGAM|nr:kinase-like protein [Leucogyrophana mollusca]
MPVDLTGQITTEDKYPTAHGGFSDIWRGTWNKDSTSIDVAVKVIRTDLSASLEDNEKKQKSLRRELQVWRRLCHQNVLPLYGLTSGFGHFQSMVCPWVENGTLNKYLEKRHKDLGDRRRWELIRDVAAGLHYLHSCSVIHGDLSGSNVLIDHSGKACLSDFGLSTVVHQFQGTHYFTSSIRGAVRWAAPELFEVSEDDIDSPPLPTTRSDIYSFGSVMLQTLSGAIPYCHLRNDAQVLIAKVKGSTPKRPPSHEVNDVQWDFIQRCWSTHKRGIDRPSINEIVDFVDHEYKRTKVVSNECGKVYKHIEARESINRPLIITSIILPTRIYLSPSPKHFTIPISRPTYGDSYCKTALTFSIPGLGSLSVQNLPYTLLFAQWYRTTPLSGRQVSCLLNSIET